MGTGPVVGEEDMKRRPGWKVGVTGVVGNLPPLGLMAQSRSSIRDALDIHPWSVVGSSSEVAMV